MKLLKVLRRTYDGCKFELADGAYSMSGSIDGYSINEVAYGTWFAMANPDGWILGKVELSFEDGSSIACMQKYEPTEKHTKEGLEDLAFAQVERAIHRLCELLPEYTYEIVKEKTDGLDTGIDEAVQS